MEAYLREVDTINQRHNDAVEGLIRQIREAETRKQPTESLKARLGSLEEDRQREIDSAEKRLSDAKAQAMETRPLGTGSGTEGAAPTSPGSLKPASGSARPQPKPAPNSQRGYGQMAPVMNSAPSPEITVDGSGIAPVVEFRRGEGESAAPVAPAGAGEGVEEIQF